MQDLPTQTHTLGGKFHGEKNLLDLDDGLNPFLAPFGTLQPRF